MIKKLLDLGNRYAEQSSWVDFALTKFCLFSMGLIAGTAVKEKYRKPVICASIAVFAASYIPLMRKLIGIALNKEN